MAKKTPQTYTLSSNVNHYPLPTNIKVPKPTAAQLLAFIGATKVTGGSKF